MSLYCYEDQVVKYNFHIILFGLVMLSSHHIFFFELRASPFPLSKRKYKSSKYGDAKGREGKGGSREEGKPPT